MFFPPKDAVQAYLLARSLFIAVDSLVLLKEAVLAYLTVSLLPVFIAVDGLVLLKDAVLAAGAQKVVVGWAASHAAAHSRSLISTPVTALRTKAMPFSACTFLTTDALSQFCRDLNHHHKSLMVQKFHGEGLFYTETLRERFQKKQAYFLFFKARLPWR